MAISANTVWEVRTTGSDSSGGGFVAGATGQDFSQQDAAQFSGTNLAVDATTNTDVTPDGHTPASTDVGNLIQITTTGGGAAFTTGFYQIASIVSGKWRLDRSPAATSSSGATWAMGGALLTLGKLAGAMAASNKAFVKAGSGYTTTSSITFGTTGVNAGSSTPPNRLVGYATTRGDGGRATLTLSTNTGLTALIFTNNGWYVEGIYVDCANLGTSTGISMSGNGVQLYNCKVANFKTRGIILTGGNGAVIGCEFTGGASGSTCAVQLVASNYIAFCYVHGNACTGILINSNNTAALYNLVANNTGASSDGITAGGCSVVVGNTIYGNGRHGIGNSGSNFYFNNIFKNNLLVGNGGYGMLGCAAAGAPALFQYDGNAYYNNTSGTRSNADDTSANPVDGVSPYVNTLDVILTADPFTNAAGGDFTLNSTAGGGAACRGTGTPGVIPGTSQVGYMDLGAFQAQAAGGVMDQRLWLGGLM